MFPSTKSGSEDSFLALDRTTTMYPMLSVIGDCWYELPKFWLPLKKFPPPENPPVLEPKLLFAP